MVRTTPLTTLTALTVMAAASAAAAMTRGTAGGAVGDEYSVPEAEVLVQEGGAGFSVSIPDNEGVTLFAIHGNLNRDIGALEAGEFSADVIKPDGDSGRWTFRRRTGVHLRPGDRLYYWLFVIRHGLGYRSDVRVFQVADAAESIEATPSRAPDVTQQIATSAQSVQAQLPASDHPKQLPRRQPPAWASAAAAADDDDDHLISGEQPERGHPPWMPPACEAALEAAAELREENVLLRTLAERHTSMWRTLRAEGRLPEGDPLATVRAVLREKLRLPRVTVVSAERDIDSGITFQVADLPTYLAIAKAAGRTQGHTGIRIVF